MRILSKIALFLAFSGTFWSSVFAASPFDIILSRAPDIAVTDIHQETSFVYMRVCNLGWSIADSNTSIALAMKKPGGGVVSTVEPVLLWTNDCHEFRMASLDELGITTSGTYNISAGAILKDGRVEKSKDNNKITRSVNIIYPSNSAPSVNSSYYYQNNNNYNNNSICNFNNNYCSNTSNNNTYGSTTYYCTPGTTNCSTVPYNNNNNYNNNAYYCNASNGYCSTNNSYYNGSTTYYRSNICPPYDNACNNSYYSSTNTQYRDNSNRYCTYANNYCNDNNSYNNSYNNYNYYNNNNNNQYDLPDLVVQKIYQNSSDKYIIAQICNQGGDMRNSTSIRTNFTINDTTRSIYNTVQMARGQCTSSVVYMIPSELGIVSNGNYSIGVVVDTNNNLSERDEANNTLTQYLYIETDRNQKSDLIVDRILANDNTRTITTRICNIGDDMPNYNSWTMEITNTTISVPIRNLLSRLSRWQCTEVNTSYSNLGVYRSWGYNFQVLLDIDNVVTEQSKGNNTMNQYIQVYGNNY